MEIDQNNMEELPCGCKMGTTTDSKGEKLFLYEPCSLDCQYYKFVVEETLSQNKPIITIDVS